MKTLLFTTCALLASMIMAKPSISYVEQPYTFDPTKVSGLPSAGSLVTKDMMINGVALKTLEAKAGEEACCLIAIDDPEGIKSIRIECVSIPKPNVEECPISFSQPYPFKEGNLSHWLVIKAKIEEPMLIEYTLNINGVSIKLPLSLQVKE